MTEKKVRERIPSFRVCIYFFLPFPQIVHCFCDNISLPRSACAFFFPLFLAAGSRLSNHPARSAQQNEKLIIFLSPRFFLLLAGIPLYTQRTLLLLLLLQTISCSACCARTWNCECRISPIISPIEHTQRKSDATKQ